MLAQDRPIYWALMLPFLVRFPSWGLFSSVRQASTWPHSHANTYSWAMSASIFSELQLLPCGNYQKRLTYPHQHAQWSQPMGLPGEHWNTAARPTGCLAFSWIYLATVWCRKRHRKGLVEGFLFSFLNVWGWPTGGDGGWMRQSRSFRCGGSRH